ncbi:hypothetical protein DFJ74DRAFT_706014 [Hyaloraphidium curvatum]|nr:hypothetical protein DFJ74DRAFT_706014 [Hyaloraphidium curvatum]
MPGTPGPSATGDTALAPFRAFDPSRAAWVSPDGLPAAARALLVHSGTMTARLRAHHGEDIAIAVVRAAPVEAGEGRLLRASLLRGTETGRPLELGFLDVRTDLLPPRAQEMAVQAEVPFGAVLVGQGVPHSCHPGGYFALEAGAWVAGLLGAKEGELLYGRCNVIRTGEGEVLAEVVEVLPPERPDAGSED